MSIEYVGGPSVWTAQEMRASRRWIREMSDAERAELRRALGAVASVSTHELRFGRAEFPLGNFGARVDRIREEVEAGSGVTLLRGLPIAEWDLDTMKRAFWGIGSYIGTSLAQTQRGALLVEVTEGRRPVQGLDGTRLSHHAPPAVPQRPSRRRLAALRAAIKVGRAELHRQRRRRAQRNPPPPTRPLALDESTA